MEVAVDSSDYTLRTPSFETVAWLLRGKIPSFFAIFGRKKEREESNVSKYVFAPLKFPNFLILFCLQVIVLYGSLH